MSATPVRSHPRFTVASLCSRRRPLLGRGVVAIVHQRLTAARSEHRPCQHSSACRRPVMLRSALLSTADPPATQADPRWGEPRTACQRLHWVSPPRRRGHVIACRARSARRCPYMARCLIAAFHKSTAANHCRPASPLSTATRLHHVRRGGSDAHRSPTFRHAIGQQVPQPNLTQTSIYGD